MVMKRKNGDTAGFSEAELWMCSAQSGRGSSRVQRTWPYKKQRTCCSDVNQMPTLMSLSSGRNMMDRFHLAGTWRPCTDRWLGRLSVW